LLPICACRLDCLAHAGNAFGRRRQIAELEYLTISPAAATTLAENYSELLID
jgi:hypothetical protein